MKSELLFVTGLLVILSGQGSSVTPGPAAWPTVRPKSTTEGPQWTTGGPRWTTEGPQWTTGETQWTTGETQWTTELPARNLHGRMFTLSRDGGGSLSLFRPYSAPPSRPFRYPRSTYYPWTTSEPTRGVSVCLRYITDVMPTSSSSLFTLYPSSTPLKLGISYGSVYWLSCDRYSYQTVNFQPSIRILPHTKPDIWTRVCLTVDTRRKLAQVFSGSNMSIRKFVPSQCVWSGESALMFSGFDGQVTDVQMWDYPLDYAEIYSYMMGGFYTPYQGSVLSWSYITYSLRGQALLENAYKQQGFSRRGRGHQLKEGKQRRKLLKEETKDGTMNAL